MNRLHHKEVTVKREKKKSEKLWSLIGGLWSSIAGLTLYFKGETVANYLCPLCVKYSIFKLLLNSLIN